MSRRVTLTDAQYHVLLNAAAQLDAALEDDALRDERRRRVLDRACIALNTGRHVPDPPAVDPGVLARVRKFLDAWERQPSNGRIRGVQVGPNVTFLYADDLRALLAAAEPEEKP